MNHAFLLSVFAAATVVTAGTDLTAPDWSKLNVPSDSAFQWEQKAPGDGGTSWYLRIHPADPNCLVQSCDMSASYITHDGSKSYTSINHPDWGFPRMHYLSGVDFCETAPDIGYAGSESNGIFKTTDRGRSWSRVSTTAIERIFDWKFPRIPISTIAVNPANPNDVWAGTGFPRRLENRGKRRLPQGLIHSTDGGKTWQHLPQALPQGEMALHILMFRELPGVILVGTDGGIHLSQDNGKSFKAMMKNLPPGATFCDLDGVIDPKSGQPVLVTALESAYHQVAGKVTSSGGIWRCDGLNGDWREITGDLRIPASLLADLADFKTGKAGNPYWQIGTKMLWDEFMADPVNRDLYRNTVLNYHKDPAPFHRKWNQTRNNYKKLEAYGKSAKETLDTILPDFHTIRLDPRNPDVVYTSIFNPWVPYGVWKTTDGGRHWNCITRGAQGWENPAWDRYCPSASPRLNLKQAWTSRHPMNYGTPQLTFGFWDVRKFDLSRSNPDILYFHSHRITYRSEDAGRTWLDASNRIVDASVDRFAGLGNSNMCVFDLAIHPQSPDKILFWMADCGLKISNDGGKTLFGLPHVMVGSNQWVMAAAFDPADPNRFYAVFNCRDWLVGGLKGQYFIESRDFGKTFTGMQVKADGSTVMPPVQKAFTTNVAQLLVDPASPPEQRRFLATHSQLERYGVCTGTPLGGSTPGDGIIESVDGGKTWIPANQGLGKVRDIVDLVPVPGDFSTIYAAAAMHRNSTQPGGLFVSRNRAKSWEPLPACPLTSVTQVVPTPDGRLFIAGGVKEFNKRPENRGGVYVSNDGGKTWTCLLAAPLVSTLAVNPKNPQIIYCTVERGSDEQISAFGVWRSADGGKTWSRLNHGLAGAYNFTRLKWHPVHPDQLWLGTYGSGFYRLRDPAVAAN